MRRLAALLCVLVAGGCDLARSEPGVDAGPGLDGPPPVNPDLVAPIGTATTLDIACWNVENFPKSTYTVGLLADLIASLELDLIVVEEVASVEAWNDLMARLPEHEGVLSTHRYTPTDYQKIGVIYRTGLVTLGPPELLFLGDTAAFPRPPFKVHVDAAGLSFDAIGVHLKAGVAQEDADRRADALRRLDTYLRAQVDGGGEDEVLVLGDYNENLTTDEGRTVLGPFLDAPDRYRFLTEAAAQAGARSFLPSGKVIDHIVATAGLYDELGATAAQLPRLDQQVPRYDPELSDHLPAVVSIRQP